MFFKRCVHKNFANFTGKHLCWGLFLIKLQALRPATSLKRDSTHVFSSEICEIFKNTFPQTKPPLAASEPNIAKKLIKTIKH